MAPNGITEYIVARWRGEQRVCVRNQSISQLMRTTRSLIKTPLHSGSVLQMALFATLSLSLLTTLSGQFLHTTGLMAVTHSHLPFFLRSLALFSRAHFFLGLKKEKIRQHSRPPEYQHFSSRVVFPPTTHNFPPLITAIRCAHTPDYYQPNNHSAKSEGARSLVCSLLAR